MVVMCVFVGRGRVLIWFALWGPGYMFVAGFLALRDGSG